MYIDKIPDNARQIKNSKDYVDDQGNVYGIENRNNGHKGQPFIKTQSTVYGYKYCGINYDDGRHVSKRVHKLVAEAFIDNPENLPIVLHKDNNKANNNVSNLKWGTVSENTKQAVDDGLIVNDKGFDDSQSMPCECYSALTNEHINTYGSVSLAAEDTGVTKCGILYQMKNPDAPIRKPLYFVPYGEGPKPHDIICQYDFESDAELARFTTIGKASKETGISDSTISAQVKLGEKPGWTSNGTYFLKQQLS